MNPAMSGSTSNNQRPQKRKREIDSNDEDKKNSNKRAGKMYEEYNAIEQAPTDNRGYCCLKLSNDLHVLVVSDSDCEMANVHLMVKCGFFNDPESLPGLAHYLEHMVNLTNTKIYPKINQLQVYLSEHGGYLRADTTEDRTNYSFTVLSDNLSDAMTRFSDAIVSPKFDKNLFRNEVNAIDTEFKHYQQKSEYNQFWAALSKENPHHPCGRFGCGNKETLCNRPETNEVDVQIEMENLCNKHYISSNMCLVVIGKETTDTLANMVVDSKFGHMQTKSSPAVILNHVIQKTNRIAYINFAYNTRYSLKIQWKIDGYSRWYPVKCINILMEHKGPKGLLAILKEKKWAFDIHADFLDICTNSTIYFVDITLSLEGIENNENVVGIVYSYINFLKETQLLEDLDTMCKDMAEHDFLYNQNREDYAAFLCGRLWDVCNHSLSVENILKGYALPREGAEMMDFLEQLRPDNGRIIVSGNLNSDKHEIAKDTDIIQHDEWYPMRYFTRDIDPNTIQEWEKSSSKHRFDIPDFCTYYPVNKSFETSALVEKTSLEPVLIFNTKLCKVWYKQDSPVLKPFVSFRLCVTPAYTSSHMEMFLAVWNELLQHLFYPAKFGGLSLTIDIKDNFFTVLVEGYPQYLKEFVKIVMETMLDVIKVKPEKYYHLLHREPERKGKYNAFRVWLNTMIPKVKQLLFLVCGHISKDDAINLCNEVKYFFKKGKEEGVAEEKRITNTDDAYNNPEPLPRYTKNLVSFLNLDMNRCVLAKFDCTGACADFGQAIVGLFCHVFKRECHIYLRTICPLAYRVEMYSDSRSELAISAGAEGNHDIVQMEIEHFLSYIIDSKLSKLPDETLADHKASMEREYKLKPINQREAHSRYWGRLLQSSSATDENYFTDLAKDDENYFKDLCNIQMSDLKEFYKKYIHPDGDSVIYTITGDLKKDDNSVYAQFPNLAIINPLVQKFNKTIVSRAEDKDEFATIYDSIMDMSMCKDFKRKANPTF